MFDRRRIGATLAVVCSLVGGCSLLGEFGTERCQSPQDCAGYGLVNAQCVAGNCTRQSSPTTDAGDAATTVDADAGPAAECTGHGSCTAKAGVPSACVDGRCQVAMVPGVCPWVAGEQLLADTSVVLGAFTYVDGVVNTSPGIIAIQQALNEINANGGLPAGPGRPARPVSVVVCQVNAPSDAAKGIEHLTKTLHVPIVYGMVESADLDSIRERVVLSKTLVLSLLANDTKLRAVDFQNLLWFGIGPLPDTAPGLNAAVKAAEAKVRATTGTDVKVAVFASKARDMQEVANGLEAAGTFNGRSYADNKTMDLYGRYDVNGLYTQPGQNYATEVQAITQTLKADIVVGIGGDEITQLVETLEGVPYRVEWVLGQFVRYRHRLLDPIAKVWDTAGVRARIRGVDFAGDRGLMTAYEANVADSYPTQQQKRQGHNYLYDGTYLAALAMHATPGRFPRGDEVSGSMSRLFTGVKLFDVPSNDGYRDAVAALSGGESIRLRGTTGEIVVSDSAAKPPRNRTMGLSLFCIAKPSAGVYELRYYAASYNAGTGQFGAIDPACP